MISSGVVPLCALLVALCASAGENVFLADNNEEEQSAQQSQLGHQSSAASLIGMYIMGGCPPGWVKKILLPIFTERGHATIILRRRQDTRLLVSESAHRVVWQVVFPGCGRLDRVFFKGSRVYGCPAKS